MKTETVVAATCRWLLEDLARQEWITEEYAMRTFKRINECVAEMTVEEIDVVAPIIKNMAPLKVIVSSKTMN